MPETKEFKKGDQVWVFEGIVVRKGKVMSKMTTVNNIDVYEVDIPEYNHRDTLIADYIYKDKKELLDAIDNHIGYLIFAKKNLENEKTGGNQ